MKKNKILKFSIIPICIISMIVLGNLYSGTIYSQSLNTISAISQDLSNLPLSINAEPYFAWGTNGKPISTTTDYQQWVHACSDGAGGILITWWHAPSGPGPDTVYAQRVDSNGKALWGSNGKLVSSSSNNKDYPKICSDGAGGAIISWEENKGSPSFIDVYAQRIAASGALMWGPNGTVICNSTGNQEYAHIISDNNGGAIIAWTDGRTGSDDIYAQRINSAGITQWVPNGTVLCNETSGDQYTFIYPIPICSDGAQGAIVTWTDTRTPYDSIYAQHIDSTGTITWAPNGTLIGNLTATQGYPAICSDGAGGAIITWHGTRDVNYDVSAQLINSAGTTMWGNNGITVCNASSLQWYPVICEDGFGGAIIAWKDQRDSSDDDIYAQKINSAGTPLWGANGTLICNATLDQEGLAICNDTAGGAIIAWSDERNTATTSRDIYAQWINSTGYAMWENNGTVVCNETGQQGDFYEYRPYIDSDGKGGAVIAWMDQRKGGGDWDIYAQHIANSTPAAGKGPDMGLTALLLLGLGEPANIGLILTPIIIGAVVAVVVVIYFMKKRET